MIKALTATGWGKQKETLMATYNAVIRPALEYACCVVVVSPTPPLKIGGGIQQLFLRTQVDGISPI